MGEWEERLDPGGREPRSFVVAQTSRIGTKRRRGAGSFIDGVADVVNAFYVDVLRALRAWTPPAPRARLDQSSAEGSEESRAGQRLTGLT